MDAILPSEVVRWLVDQLADASSLLSSPMLLVNVVQVMR